MKDYRLVGNHKSYEMAFGYKINKGDIFQEDIVLKGWEETIKEVVAKYPEDWELVNDEIEENTTDFEEQVTTVLDDLRDLLISKNKKYGDSALNPIRVFSKTSNVEQIKVRLDDKLSRLRTQHIEEDEDVLNDLIGYLILLKIANDD